MNTRPEHLHAIGGLVDLYHLVDCRRHDQFFSFLYVICFDPNKIDSLVQVLSGTGTGTGSALTYWCYNLALAYPVLAIANTAQVDR